MSKSDVTKGGRWWVSVLMVVWGVPTVMGGTQGAYMNSLGYGRAAASIFYSGQVSSLLSPPQYYPCAAVNPLNTFVCANAPAALPSGTPPSVYCQSKGGPNFVWRIQSYVTGGATADHPELESRVNIIPAPCASYDMASSAVFNDAFSGSITVNATATQGAALWVRGYEFLGEGEPQSLEELQENGELKWDLLLVGPFDLQQDNCTALTIPFTTRTGHENLYFVADGVAKSTPLEVVCAGDVTFGCGEPVIYPEVEVNGGCGKVTLSYDPPVDELPPGDALVTVTAMDEAGNVAHCTFMVVREVLTFQGFYPPLGGPGGSCSAPGCQFKVGSKIPVKFMTFCSGSTFLEGSPTLSIRKCGTTQNVVNARFQMVANQWHYNWETKGLAKGTYLLTATLQDGTQRGLYVRLK